MIVYESYENLDFEVESDLMCRVDAYSKMIDMGYCTLNSDDFNLTDKQELDLKLIQEHFDTLAIDPYDETSGRYRQHYKYVFFHCLNLLFPQSPDAASHYKQDIKFNDEVTPESRKFQSVPNTMLSNELIRALIFHDFKNSPLYLYPSTVPMEVGIHFIRMKTTAEAPSIPVPNRLHKDGEPCTWVHLINREGVSGGENIITDNSQVNILCEHLLIKPLDSVGVVDDLVWHQVKPVTVDEYSEVGFRDVILIDFTPMFAMSNNP